jgi:hypothetical protein
MNPVPGTALRAARGHYRPGVADAVPGGRYVTLDGQDHGVLQQPDILRPLLTSYSNAE